MMKVLQITPHFYPNLGGVETHLTDLVNALIKREWQVMVLTYQPLTINKESKVYEKKDKLLIVRVPYFKGLFYKLVAYPLLEFLYLVPGLFLITPLVLLINEPDVIHAHGLVAGFVGVFWGKLFAKKVIVSTHSIYHFPKKGLYRDFVRWIFNNCSFCLALSNQAVEDIKSLRIDNKKITRFTYWIDLDHFHKINNAKNILGWKDFTVLFAGRLIKEKGVLELLESVSYWNKRINLVIIGSGPLEKDVKLAASRLKNVKFIGLVDPQDMPTYYSGSDILIVPSVHEEGFGRVILESLACGTPVIGSNRGAIPEAMDNSVGKLIDANVKNIKQTVEFFYSHRAELNILSNNCRKFVMRKFSEKNVEKIIKSYSK